MTWPLEFLRVPLSITSRSQRMRRSRHVRRSVIPKLPHHPRVSPPRSSQPHHFNRSPTLMNSHRRSHSSSTSSKPSHDNSALKSAPHPSTPSSSQPSSPAPAPAPPAPPPPPHSSAAATAAAAGATKTLSARVAIPAGLFRRCHGRVHGSSAVPLCWCRR